MLALSHVGPWLSSVSKRQRRKHKTDIKIRDKRFYCVQDESVRTHSVVYSLQALKPGALHGWPAAWGEGFSPEGSRSLPVFCEESDGAADTQRHIFMMSHADRVLPFTSFCTIVVMQTLYEYAVSKHCCTSTPLLVMLTDLQNSHGQTLLNKSGLDK